MEKIQMEVMFLLVLFLPTALAIIAWIYKHTNTISGAEMAPTNYWGSYHNDSPGKQSFIRLPETAKEEFESASHIHTIGVHP
jgi:hypothetical protein